MALDPSLYTTLKTDIEANTDPTVIQALADRADNVIADWYNGDSAFYVFKQGRQALADVGDQMDGAELGNMTGANTDRLNNFFTMRPSGIDGSRADNRAFFEDVFSGAGGAITRPKLGDAGTFWSRLATFAEAVFASGTGTQGDPGTLGGFSGNLTANDVSMALNNG